MKLEMKLILVCFFLFGLHSTAEASKIKRGFEALKIHDYFKAKTNFERGMKYNSSAGAFGLANVFSRNDNPFFSLDSAYKYIRIAREGWPEAKDGKKLRWAAYGWTDQGIDSLRNQISTQVFQKVSEQNSIAAYSQFISDHSWAKEAILAAEIRDSLAFFEAVNKNTSKAYEQFLAKYPQSRFTQLATDNFYDAQFEEITVDRSLASYQEFVRLNPTSPLVTRAEREIFQIVTKPNTVEAYDVFIKKYPTNSFVPEASRMLYESFIAKKYSTNRIQAFLEQYPSTPIKAYVEKQLAAEKRVLLPTIVSAERGYAFMDTAGVLQGDSFYDQLNPYKEGLAVFLSSETNKFGAVNKLGEVQIDPEFDEMSDFNEGLSIVSKDDKYGVIHRNGKFILECVFEDLGTFSNGLIFAAKNELYGYYDMNGRQRIEHKFEDAFDFVNQSAKVVFEGNEALIDIYGTYIVPPVVERIAPFSDSLYIFEEDGMIGLMNRLGKVFLPAEYEYIGQLKDNLALVSDGERVFYINAAGTVVISGDYETFPNYALRGEFKDGAAVVHKKELYGRVNTSGKVISEIKYENLGMAQDILPFSKDGLWGVLSFANKVIVQPQYNTLELQGDNYIIAQLNGFYGVIDQTGKQVVPFEFREIVHLTDDAFAVTNLMDQLGVFRKGKLVVPTEFQRISVFDKDFLILSNNGLSYYDLSNDRLITYKPGLSE